MTHGARQAAVEGMRLELILMTFPALCSTGELADSMQALGKGVPAVLAHACPWRMRDALCRSQYGSGGDFLGCLP